MDVLVDELWVEAMQAAQTWVQQNSPWELLFREGNGGECQVELLATLKHRGPGVLWEGGPRQAQILFCSGPTTPAAQERLREVFAGLHEPKFVVTFGTRAITGRAYGQCLDVSGHVDEVLPVDVYVLGFPPRPEALLDGVQALLRPLMADHEKAIARAAGSDVSGEVVARELARRNAPPTKEEMNRDQALAERPPF